ncbi:TetR/AcrR family transcriptional regulator [Thalassotalea sediminis]|uniref:TetR/AcrR family transcriptional regulator n=1 Tax=Thalassotalea sediminis TaxID=1759089 RepID=UPI0025736381|nr:TetR/AcrR family transcriptional regulator [Thalassotalea sediminis]
MAKSTKYDRQEVIKQATNLYWKKGFHATSMRNLQDEIDMRPGSIYAAFGSKDGLFIEALRYYTDMGIAQVEKCRLAHDSPLEALKAFVKYQVIDSKDSAPNSICLLTKTIGELTNEHQDLIELTKKHLREVAQEFSKLIQHSQSLGEISTQKTSTELADYVQIQIAGLRSFAKIDDDERKLNAMINDIFSHYPFSTT